MARVRAMMMAAVLLSMVGRAHAAPQLSIGLTGCEGTDLAAVKRLAAIELSVEVTAEGAPRTTRVEIVCTGSVAEIAVDDPLTGKRLARTLNLDATVPAARARLLALGASELVAASWAELEARARPKVEVVGALPREEARRTVEPALERARARSPQRLRLTAVAVEQTFFTGAGALWGAALRVGRDEWFHLGWVFDVQATHGVSQLAVGAISLDLVGAGLAFWLHRRWSRVTLRGGPGLRGGAVRFGGSPADARPSPASASGARGWVPP